MPLAPARFAVLAPLLFGSLGAHLAPASAPGAARGGPEDAARLERYLAARDRHDVEALLALHAAEARVRVDGRALTRDELRAWLEREAVLEVRWEPRAGGAADGAILLDETSRLQRALGVPRARRLELVWSGDLVVTSVLEEAAETAGDWAAALAELRAWLARAPGDPGAPDRLLAPGAAAARALLSRLAEWERATAEGRARNEEILESFLAALNRHDVDAQFGHYAPDFAYVDEGRRIAPQRESERDDRAFEAANGARWSHVVVWAGPETLDLVLTESMAFYEHLGVGPRSHRARYRFRGAELVEARAWGWTQAGRPYEEARDAFTAWVRARRPREAAEVAPRGRHEFGASTAATIERLVREWAAGAAPPARSAPAFEPERGPAAWLDAPGVAWSSALGTARVDWINRVVRLRDGALLAVGFVGRDDAPGAGEEWDVVVLEHTPEGELARALRHGGPGLESAWAVAEDAAGRLVLCGFAWGAGGADDWDAYLLVLARDGAVLAEQRYGGPAHDRATDLVPTADGGYLLVGETRSQGAGERDVFLVRVDALGRELWRRTHGGPRMERAFAGIPRAGGGAVVIGTCGAEGDVDGLVLAVDEQGGEVWRRTLAGERNVVPHHVAALPDGRILVTGYTDSFGAESNDALAVVLAPDGALLGHELLGGAGDDRVMTAAVAPDGSAWLVGYTRSAGAGGWDVLLARLGADGRLEARGLALGTARDEHGTTVLPLADGALVLGGYAVPAGPATAPSDLFLLRLAPARAAWSEGDFALTRIE